MIRHTHSAHDTAEAIAAAQHPGCPSPSKQARNVASLLWAGFFERLAAWRKRRAAAVLYTELSKLSDGELRRRGVARVDLHQLASEMAER
jgi:hypothetical protein